MAGPIQLVAAVLLLIGIVALRMWYSSLGPWRPAGPPDFSELAYLRGYLLHRCDQEL